jgi:hypothetical protein
MKMHDFNTNGLVTVLIVIALILAILYLVGVHVNVS